MIQLTPSKPRLVRNLEHIEEPLTLVENAAKMAVHNLNESMRRFWEKSDEEIEEMLNHQGLEGIERIFTAHHGYGSMLNQLLADRVIDEPRVNLTRPRDFTVDSDTGRISLVPLPEPEPETNLDTTLNPDNLNL